MCMVLTNHLGRDPQTGQCVGVCNLPNSPFGNVSWITGGDCVGGLNPLPIPG